VHGLGFFLSNSRGIQGKDLEAVSRLMREEMHGAGSSAVASFRRNIFMIHATRKVHL
jgi:hypothetical protein